MKNSTLRQNGLLSLGNVGHALGRNRPPQCRAREYRQATRYQNGRKVDGLQEGAQEKGIEAQ